MWPLTARDVIEGCGARRPALGGAGDVTEGDLVGGATGSLVDLSPGDLFVALPFVNGDAHAHVEDALSRGAALALVAEVWPGPSNLSPELRARCVVVPDVLAAFRRLAAAFRRRLSCPVVAVAGSNGKTTTKDMLAALLSSPGRRVVKTPGTDNGFLGLPQTLCGRAHRAPAPADAVVLEIGIDAPLAMAEHARMIAPDVAVITALGPEHLGGLGDVATAVREELSLVLGSPAARRVLPLDDPEIAARTWLLRTGDVAVARGASLSGAAAALPEGVRVLLFSPRLSGADSVVKMAFFEAGERGSPAHRLELRCPLPGIHNARNLALATAAALLVGRSPEEIRAGSGTFRAPPFRSRIEPLARGALLYDDCFNASPLSVQAALEALGDPAWAGRPKVVVLGDMLDLGAESGAWHLEVASRLAEMEGVRACLFGAAMSAVAARLVALGHGGRVLAAQESGDPAGLVAGLDLPEGAVVLVKGSRGMRLERVVGYLELRWARDHRAALGAASRRVTMVAVAGAAREETARAVTEALRYPGEIVARADETGMFLGGELLFAGSPPAGVTEVLFRAAAAGASHAVVSLRHEDLLSAAADCHFPIVVYTGLSATGLPTGVDAETHLAHVAQLVIRDPGPRALVLLAGDPACELLAEIAPPGIRVLRYGAGASAPGGGDSAAASVAQVVGALGGSAEAAPHLSAVRP